MATMKATHRGAGLTISMKSSVRRDAVCFGCNIFAALPEATLGGCVADATKWQRFWQDRNFDDVRLYVDQQATKEVAKEELTRLVIDAKTDDEKVFQMSSHGTWDVDREGDEEDHRDEAFCFHDLAQKGPLTDDEISAILNRSRKRFKMLLIMDTCHSGTSTRMIRAVQSLRLASLTDGKAKKLPRVKYLSPSEWIGNSRKRAAFERDAIAAGGIKIIARNRKPLQRALGWNACQDHEFAYDAEFDGQPNGAFTFFAERALRERLKMGAVAPTMQEMQRAIRQYLPADVYPQQPNLYGTRTMFAWRVFGG